MYEAGVPNDNSIRGLHAMNVIDVTMVPYCRSRTYAQALFQRKRAEISMLSIVSEKCRFFCLHSSSVRTRFWAWSAAPSAPQFGLAARCPSLCGGQTVGGFSLPYVRWFFSRIHRQWSAGSTLLYASRLKPAPHAGMPAIEYEGPGNVETAGNWIGQGIVHAISRGLVGPRSRRETLLKAIT